MSPALGTPRLVSRDARLPANDPGSSGSDSTARRGTRLRPQEQPQDGPRRVAGKRGGRRLRAAMGGALSALNCGSDPWCWGCRRE